MKTKPASHASVASLLAVTVFVLSSPLVLAQGTTEIRGTFAPSGKYSVDGNLSLMPLTTMQCSVAPRQTDKVEVSGVAMLDGRLLVTMTGRFAHNGPARYTLLEARGGRMGIFSLVSIRWATDQGLSARITYDPNHVYLEIAFEPGEFPPPLDTQQPHEISPAPAPASGARRADKPSSTAGTVFRPTVAGLTFADRVAYQYAIEEVYWRHRLWPKDNPRSKPPLDAMISREQIEEKVADYLRKSQFVTDRRSSAITASELQAEIDRMGSHSKQPEVLRELFQALGNDPFVIAECLARPVVAERIVSQLTTQGVEAFVPTAYPRDKNARVLATSASTTQLYNLPEISPIADCTDDAWSATSSVNAPGARVFQTAVWTGVEMIVWGGNILSPPYVVNTGGRYNPSTDSWIATSLLNAPDARNLHTAVWTGSEMIVWGGYGNGFLNTGGRYNPMIDTWTPTATANAPVARDYHTAVWTGSEMIVWGGFSYPDEWFNTGGRYTPSNDTWTATSTTNAPEARYSHTAEWTGSEMIVWGGTNQTIYLNTGGRYDPSEDSWTATSVPNNVLGRTVHTAVWTGSEMIVWAGTDSTFNDCNTGGRYNPAADSWSATSTMNAPHPRDSHAAVWTGNQMIVWGGVFCYPCMDFDTGGRYDAGADSWTPTSTANAPLARFDHTAVWTGSEMIVWGGHNVEDDIDLNTGGRYCALSGPTPTPTSSPTPTPTASATATFTPIPAPTATATATPTATFTSTPRPTLTPRSTPPARPRPTPPPRP